jgi:hypothetical protein
MTGFLMVRIIILLGPALNVPNKELWMRVF